ncbi:MAG: hypothetical protein R3E68_19945 [Burkholderiaceae bacterium]
MGLGWNHRAPAGRGQALDAPGRTGHRGGSTRCTAISSGGMKQRLQIAGAIPVTRPRLVLMDEPNLGPGCVGMARGCWTRSVLVNWLGPSAIIVTHDLGVARLLAHRTLVMRNGEIVEQGLTDRVLDDPRHPYTQLLVSSVLTP